MLFGACLAFLTAGNVIASDHLTPSVDAVVGDGSYRGKLHHLFREAYGRDVLVQVLALPSFSPEFVVGVRKRH
ncbi:MAG TPA: hypothetical protein VJA19_10955 [Pseudomonas sp.]|nr:hypothetical protein [Pseudomonas sp.]